MGVTRTHGIPGLPGNNNFKVLEAGAKKLGYKEVHTGNMSINSQPRDDRGAPDGEEAPAWRYRLFVTAANTNTVFAVFDENSDIEV
jgi:hypothetical protein